MPTSCLLRALLLLPTARVTAQDVRVALYTDGNCEHRNGTRPIGCTTLSDSTAVLYRYDRSSRQALRRFHYETDRCDDGSPSTSSAMSFTRCTPTEGGRSEQLTEEAAAGTRTICTDFCKIAWVGNSYTFYHDLPQLLTDLGASANPPVAIDYDSVTVGGSSLTRLSADKRVAEMLARDWDYVVLQDQSQIPGGARPVDRDLALLTLRDFYKPHLQRVKAEAVLYSTWGRRKPAHRIHRIVVVR
jgi:hypothetical protein